MEAIEAAGVQAVKIRSVLTCEKKYGVCGKCYGRDLARGTPVNMGEAVGVIAAQSIGEPGTQLTMRTFHIGGTAQVVDQSFLESNFEGRVEIRNRAIVTDSAKRMVVMGRNVQIVILDEGDEERASHRVPYGARLYVDDGDQVKRGQRIAEWDPYTRPVLTEVGGTVDYEDLVEGASVIEIGRRVDRHHQARRHRLAGDPARLRPEADGGDQGQERQDPEARARRRRPLPALGRRHPVGRAGHAGEARRRAWRASRWKAPRRATSPAVCRGWRSSSRRAVRRTTPSSPRSSGTVRFGRDYKNKRRIIIEPTEEGAEPVEYLIPKGRPFHLQEGDAIEKGDFILDGLPAPHDILAIKGVEELAAYLVNEIQEVYRLQGVLINDKHIEVIVRQMLQKVEITKTGDSDLIAGEQIDRLEFDALNEALRARRRRNRRRPSRCCSASPRRACRPAPSSRRRRSRRPPAC